MSPAPGLGCPTRISISEIGEMAGVRPRPEFQTGVSREAPVFSFVSDVCGVGGECGRLAVLALMTNADLGLL